MRFDELQRGDVFEIDGQPYEAETIGERIVIGIKLFAEPCDIGTDLTARLVRMRDPEDLAGDQYLTDAFSDLRFNRNNLTDFERQCDEELKALL